jgi:hypothetical protein
VVSSCFVPFDDFFSNKTEIKEEKRPNFTATRNGRKPMGMFVEEKDNLLVSTPGTSLAQYP